MHWQELRDGAGKRFVLDDGAQMIGVITVSDGAAQIAFFADCENIESAGAQSERLGEDVIDICCAMDRTAKAS
jgi:hypothetical protein